MAVARLFYDSYIPINVINSIYFQPMVDAITAICPGYKIPTYNNLCVNLLRDARKEVQLLVDGYKKTWEDVGCTLMTDGWTDNSHRSLINFLVYCPKGVCFVKSVDASDVVKDATTLFNLFEEIALWVGPNNIVHLVTDNGANYKAARRMLSEKYSSITWSPCVAHCINLMLKDIAKMSHIVNLSKRASEVTNIITKVVSPLMRMLRIVDSDERPSIGYVYDGMYRTRMEIKKLFKNKKSLYKPYTTIIKMRWDRMLRRDIHATAYYLNPAFKYDGDTFSKKPEVMSRYKKITYNLVDYESIDKTEWWMVDEEEEVGELNYDELEQSLYGEGVIPIDGGDHPSYYDSTDASEDDIADVTNDDDHLWDDV
ncbi:uncharacterized protein LOC116107835 [Pistacia vera]|uniref:uncharacterized protein LOC116107835 n=1 Tax=Pistacia vera TaxID=55513 RepID=UPI001262C594|nr:uncharacterized protein LOC116107835 [Pistacia vera]